MSIKQPCVVIHGIREDGEHFRPGDWVERIASSVAGFGSDRRLRYVSAVRPKIIDGERCLVVDGILADTSPDLYRYIIDFAHSNGLMMRESVCPQVILA